MFEQPEKELHGLPTGWEQVSVNKWVHSSETYFVTYDKATGYYTAYERVGGRDVPRSTSVLLEQALVSVV